MVQTKFEIRNTIEVVRVSQRERPPQKKTHKKYDSMGSEGGGVVGQDFIGNVKTDFGFFFETYQNMYLSHDYLSLKNWTISIHVQGNVITNS